MAPKYLLGIVALAAVFAAEAKPSADAEVLSSVLSHFASREDSLIGKQGLILIRPQNGNWTDRLLRGFSLRRGDDECPITAELYDRLIQRNAADSSIQELIRESTKWRIALPFEEAPNPAPFLDKSRGREPVRTIVRLSVPAWSSDGDTAFVMFFFRWSIHSAIAQYVVSRSPEGWSVKCSQLRFYP